MSAVTRPIPKTISDLNNFILRKGKEGGKKGGSEGGGREGGRRSDGVMIFGLTFEFMLLLNPFLS